MPGATRPYLLLFLLLLPLYGYLCKTGYLKKFELSLTLGDWKGKPFAWKSTLVSLSLAAGKAFLALAFASTVIAAAGPVRYRNESVFSGSGTTVLFVVDVSPSMAAKDMGAMTRLDGAKELIRLFVEKRPGDSFGLAAVGSDAALLIPPTRDHSVFLERLRSLRPGELGDGTALGMGLAVAAAHLRESASSASAVVLLTDGENNAGEIHPNKAASLFAQTAVSFFVVGIGSGGSVPLEYIDPESGISYEGLLESGFHETSLVEIAEAGEGKYLEAVNMIAFQEALESISIKVSSSTSSWSKTVEEPLEDFFILLALSLCVLSWIAMRLVAGAQS